MHPRLANNSWHFAERNTTIKPRKNLLQNEPLARYTAARMGGSADWLYVARDSLDDLIEVVTDAWAQDIPVQLLGGGANVLVSDQGVRGLVVINRVQEVQFGEWEIGCTASATSGTSLTVLANKCQSQGLTGFEWAVSVPGTVGGAVVNNAGAHGSDIASSIVQVVVMEPSGPKLLTVDDLQYDYRYSALKARSDKRFLVLMATFSFGPDEPAAIKSRMQSHVDYRKNTQPPGASLGSIFKNPPNDYAGRLIEAAGLKGYSIGNAMVSPVHANFFINKGGKDAQASHYFALINHVQSEVKSLFDVDLELEIECIGDWGTYVTEI